MGLKNIDFKVILHFVAIDGALCVFPALNQEDMISIGPGIPCKCIFTCQHSQGQVYNSLFSWGGGDNDDVISN